MKLKNTIIILAAMALATGFGYVGTQFGGRKAMQASGAALILYGAGTGVTRLWSQRNRAVEATKE